MRSINLRIPGRYAPEVRFVLTDLMARVEKHEAGASEIAPFMIDDRIGGHITVTADESLLKETE